MWVIKKILLLTVSICLNCTPLRSYSLSNKHAYVNNCILWGVNGHPLTQEAYSKGSWKEQLKYINDLQLDFYRFDIGDIFQDKAMGDSFMQLLKLLKHNKVSPLPVLVEQIGLKTTEEVYNYSYKQGRLFCLNFKSYFTCIELGNEEDNNLILSSAYDGTEEGHYDLLKAKLLMARFNGFINGLKSVDRTKKVIISLSWVHFYYLELLNQYKVNYDIIGYHWYSEMGDITNARLSYGNVINKVFNKHKKPIWITEFNYRGGSFNEKFKEQKSYLQESLTSILKNKHVKGFFIYELFDEPAFIKVNPGEASYGLLMKLAKENVYLQKQGYTTYKKIVSDYKKTFCN